MNCQLQTRNLAIANRSRVSCAHEVTTVSSCKGHSRASNMSRFNRAHAFFTARRVCIERTMLSQDVCSSVRSSHFGTLSTPVSISSNFFLPSGNPTILVFPYQTGWQLTILRQELCGCSIWYSDEGLGRAAAPSRPLLAVPNVTVYPSTASIPTLYYSMSRSTVRQV